MNLITDCPQEVQSLAAANLANMAKSSLGRNILKRHGGLQKLVTPRTMYKVAERGVDCISDSFVPESRLSIDISLGMPLGKRVFSQCLLPIGKLREKFNKVFRRNERLTNLLLRETYNDNFFGILFKHRSSSTSLLFNKVLCS